MRSSLPDELRKLGYDVVETGGGERILHSAIVERFTTGADGALEPLIAGSTRSIALAVSHDLSGAGGALATRSLSFDAENAANSKIPAIIARTTLNIIT
jgi:hypothetical protein